MFVGKHHCFQKTNFADDQNDPVSMVTRQIKDEFSYLFIYLIIVDIYPVTNCWELLLWPAEGVLCHLKIHYT